MKRKCLFFAFLLCMVFTFCGCQNNVDTLIEKAESEGYSAVVSRCIKTDDGSFIFFNGQKPYLVDNVTHKEYNLLNELNTGDEALFIYEIYSYDSSYSSVDYVKIVDVHFIKKGNESDITDEMLNLIKKDGWVDGIIARRNGTEDILQGERVKYGDGDGSISITIPEGWEYTIDKEGESILFINFSIKFRPKGENGWVVLSSRDSFGVCGTGLDSKTISIGDYKVSVGSYSGFNSISYMYFAFAPGDFVVEFENASWCKERMESIMQILSTATFSEGTIIYEAALDKAIKLYNKDYERVYSSYISEDGYWLFDFSYKTDGKYENESVRVYKDGRTEIVK